MSRVTSVDVLSAPPNNCQQPANGWRVSGTSSTSFTFYGVYRDFNGHCAVVVQANIRISKALSRVNDALDGGVFVMGDNGTYCTMTTDGMDLNNWTVRARSDKDKAGTGITFVGGTGGGGL